MFLFLQIMSVAFLIPVMFEFDGTIPEMSFDLFGDITVKGEFTKERKIFNVSVSGATTMRCPFNQTIYIGLAATKNYTANVLFTKVCVDQATKFYRRKAFYTNTPDFVEIQIGTIKKWSNTTVNSTKFVLYEDLITQEKPRVPVYEEPRGDIGGKIGLTIFIVSVVILLLVCCVHWFNVYEERSKRRLTISAPFL